MLGDPFGNVFNNLAAYASTRDPWVYFSTDPVPKTKIEELRYECAPVKTEKPKKPKPVTNKQLLAIVDELLAKIKVDGAAYTVLQERLDKLESKKKRSFWIG